jgi:uncharacterized membrane protein required for colicin V production
MSPVDVAVGLSLLWYAVRGYARGLFHEVMTLAALFLAMTAAFRFTPTIVPKIAGTIPGPAFVDTPIAFLLVFAATSLALRILVSILGRSLGPRSSPLNRFGGAFFGMGKGGVALGSVMLMLRTFTPTPLPNGNPSPFAQPVQQLNGSIEHSALAGRLAEITSGLFSGVVDAAEIRLRMLAASDNEGR